MDLTTDEYKNSVRRAYERACKLIPNAEVEKQYIIKAKQGDINARNVLYEKQLPALIKLAESNNYRVYTGNAAELVAVVMPIMDEAIKKFDTSLGMRFWTYLYHQAKNAMNKEKYEDHLLHVPENHVKANRRNQFAAMESGDAPISGGEGRITRFDTFTGDTEGTIIEHSQQREYRDITTKAMAALDKEEQYVVRKCFFEFEQPDPKKPDRLPWTTASLSKHSGMSKDLITRIRKTAIAKLRNTVNEAREWYVDATI